MWNNAIKYTPVDRNPEILIKSYEDNGYMIISVSDKGIGLSKEQQKSIFEKFRRAECGVEGSGVGLYLVNTIITNAGGKLP